MTSPQFTFAQEQYKALADELVTVKRLLATRTAVHKEALAPVLNLVAELKDARDADLGSLQTHEQELKDELLALIDGVETTNDAELAAASKEMRTPNLIEPPKHHAVSVRRYDHLQIAHPDQIAKKFCVPNTTKLKAHYKATGHIPRGMALFEKLEIACRI